MRVPTVATYHHGVGNALYAGVRHHRAGFLTTSPSVAIAPYRDAFGNWCSRIVAPAGSMRLAADGIVRDSGLPDPIFADAFHMRSPSDTLVYLLGSRYCETDRLSEIAWQLFEKTTPGGLTGSLNQPGRKRHCDHWSGCFRSAAC